MRCTWVWLCVGLTALVPLAAAPWAVQAPASDERPRALYPDDRAAAATKQPVGVQFRINLNYFHDVEMAKQSCKNLRRYLEMFKKYGAKSDFLFTGLAAEQINRLDPEFIRMLNEAQMPVSHHGANRPPRPEPVQRVRGEDWDADVGAIADYESHKIDPLTGALDFSQEGGLKMMQKMFNKRIVLTGRFFQASILYAEKRLGCKAMVGLRGNTGAERDAAWFVGMMNMPEEKAVPPERVKAWVTGQTDLVKELNDWIASLDRSQFHTLAIPVHDFDLLGSTGGGPAAPGRPVVTGRAEIEKLWQCYENLVNWAATNPELKVATSEEILARITDDRNRQVTREYLCTMATHLRSHLAAPPDFFPVGVNDYLSLADGFQAFAAALKTYRETGNLPVEVNIHDILGPTSYGKAKFVVPEGQPHKVRFPPGPLQSTERFRRIPEPQAVNLTVEGSKVIEAASVLNLSKEIPGSVMIGEQEVNPAIFLHLMARVYTNLIGTNQPGTIQFAGTMNVLPGKVQKNQQADSLTKLQFWTYKPERFKSDDESHDQSPLGRTGPAEKRPRPKLHISLVIHNEEDYMRDMRTGEIRREISRADYRNEAQFRHFSKAMRELAVVFQKHNAKINFQTDWTFIEGVKQWDPKFFSDLEAMGHEIDAHAHETHVKYPELWDRIKEAGGHPSPVVGGFTPDAPGKWSSRFNEMADKFRILWGAATFQHRADVPQPGYAYRPKASNWLEHDPNQKLVYIGGNLGSGPGRMLDIRTGRDSVRLALARLDPNKLNTFTLLDITDFFRADPNAEGIPQRFTASDGELGNWRTRIRAWDKWLNDVADPLVKEGKLEWKTLTQMGDLYLEFEKQNPEWYRAK